MNELFLFLLVDELIQLTKLDWTIRNSSRLEQNRSISCSNKPQFWASGSSSNSHRTEETLPTQKNNQASDMSIPELSTLCDYVNKIENWTIVTVQKSRHKTSIYCQETQVLTVLLNVLLLIFKNEQLRICILWTTISVKDLYFSAEDKKSPTSWMAWGRVK